MFNTDHTNCVAVKMSPFLLSFLSLLLNAIIVKPDTCSTEGFMELSLLEAKTTTNNMQATGLAESVETRWIITEETKRLNCISTLTEVLVGVDIRPVTSNRNQYPIVEIWRETSYSYSERTPFSQLLLSPHNFTTNGLYNYILPTPLIIDREKRYFRLGVRQPPEDRSVVRFYKVTGTGQIGKIVEINNIDVNKDPADGELVLQTSSILIYPITSI